VVVTGPVQRLPHSSGTSQHRRQGRRTFGPAFLVGLLPRLRANGNLSAFDIGIGNLADHQGNNLADHQGNVVTAFRRRIPRATFSLGVLQGTKGK
jgi:hypothetical protein